MIPKAYESFLKPYTGRAIAERLSGARREAFLANWKQMEANYADNVDAALLEEQILICPETEQALYDAQWAVTNYRPGTRPELEAAAETAVKGASDEFECAVRLLAFCRDLYKKSGGRILFYGGREEDLIRKGENLCECLARLMVSLCEVRGIPARIITHVAGGHLTTEVFLNGAWGYMDSRTGVFFLKKDGSVASVAELTRDPSIMDSQPEWVTAMISERWPAKLRVARCRERFFHPNEVNTVKPYSLSRAENYRYEWTTNRDLAALGMNRANPVYAQTAAAVFGEAPVLPKPRMLLTLSQGQTVAEPVPVFAVSEGTCVPSGRVRFSLDGRCVWMTPERVPLPVIHTSVEGAHPLYGEGGLLDPAKLSRGPHRLEAEDVDDPTIRGAVEFIIP